MAEETTLVGAKVIRIIDKERIYLFLKQTDSGHDLIAVRFPDGWMGNIAVPIKNWEKLEGDYERRKVIIDDMIEKLKKSEKNEKGD